MAIFATRVLSKLCVLTCDLKQYPRHRFSVSFAFSGWLITFRLYIQGINTPSLSHSDNQGAPYIVGCITWPLFPPRYACCLAKATQSAIIYGMRLT